jgi:hypothetical protein
LLTTVQLVALGRSRYRDVEWAAKKLSLTGRIARRWNRQGLDLIAAGLQREPLPIFCSSRRPGSQLRELEPRVRRHHPVVGLTRGCHQLGRWTSEI